MDNLNAEQLFRELNDIKEIQHETRDLVRAQNGRVRALEQKVGIIWWLLGATGIGGGAFLLPAVMRLFA